MSFTIPVINLEFKEVKEILWTKIQEPSMQRKLILVIVSIALLLDNMLYMVIVPIIPDYLRYVGSWDDDEEYGAYENNTNKVHNHHDSATGFLFASKAIVQLMVNPFSGAMIDRIGYDIPMMIGLIIMFFSTAMFACGGSYGTLFFARSLQGVGSAFADTSGLAMIADRFTEENERSRALGIALAFISFGCLVAPPFGGALYQFCGKAVPFLILALVCALDGAMLLLVMKPIKETLRLASLEQKAPSIPIWKLLMDPYIACAGWRDSILSLPKKWLSVTGATDEFGFPEDLPKLPVPELEETMTEYLRALEPTLTQQQHDRVTTIVKQFISPSGLGPKLHQYLVEKRDAEDNWAYNYWLNDMYMDIRIPTPINSNPGMVLPPRTFHTINDVAKFAAQVINGIMEHKEIIDSGQLPKERAANREKNQPLCMAQYYRLLGSCRRPGDPRDSQYLPEPRDDQHVIVSCRNQMYCVPVKAGDRGRLIEKEIESQLLFILSDAPCVSVKPPPVGLLTSEARSTWARDRQLLLQSEQNQRNIELIEQALVLICLDEPIPTSLNGQAFVGATESVHRAGLRDETNMAHEMIHGGGSDYNTGNRWFDKTMQIIICNDGTWGLCYEHSTSEGIAVVLLLEKIMNQIDNDSGAENGTAQQHLPPPERLEWEIVPEISQRMFLAAKSVDKRIADLDFFVYRYRGYGKSFIKSCKVSPDVYIQLALQLAYYKLYGHLVSTYESASTRRFLLGRVDCIRSASTEALEWAKAMCQGEGANLSLESDKEDNGGDGANRKKEHLLELFRTAVARQTDIMVMNILGHGVDIPLLGLREACKVLNDGELCELFTDESYAISQCFLLSTSQVACTSDSFMGYGPVTPKGYGCSYNPRPDEIVFCVSAFYSAGDTCASRYAKSLKESLDSMRDLLES